MSPCRGELDLELKIVEQPHLLTTQVAFSVSGPAAGVSAF